MRVDLATQAFDWPVRLMGEVTSITLGGTPSTIVPTFWGGSVRWMASGDVNLRHVWEVEGRITEHGLSSSNATLVDPPAVAVGLAGQGRTRGTVALVHVKLCTNQSIALVKGNGVATDTKYLFHNLDARYEELRARSSGGGRGGLSRSILAQVPVAVPPLPEQRRIAEILDTLDEAIRKTEQVIAKLQQMKQGLLHDLLTRGIDDNGELRDPAQHPEPFKDSPLGRIPRGWAVLMLGERLEGIDAGKSPSLDDTPANADEWGILKVSAVRPDGFRSEENKVVRDLRHSNKAYEVHDGDLLMTRANTYELVGLTCLVNSPQRQLLLCDKTLRLRVSAGTNTAFVFHASQMGYVRRQIETNATGSSGSMKNISQRVIRQLLFPFPQWEEQKSIVAALDAHDRQLDAERENALKLRTLKHGLMDDLLTGRVRVPVPEDAAA